MSQTRGSRLGMEPEEEVGAQSRWRAARGNSKDTSPRLLVSTAAREGEAVVSPPGRWH